MDPQETSQPQTENESTEMLEPTPHQPPTPAPEEAPAVPVARDRLKVVIELNGLNGVIGVMVPDTTDAFVVVYHFDVLEVEGGYMEYLLAQVAEVVERALEYWSSQPKHPAYVMPASAVTPGYHREGHAEGYAGPART